MSDALLSVILMSHGTGGTALSMGRFARRLAGCGFVVIGANHHGNTAVELYRAEGFFCWWERARDLSVLLEHVVGEPRFAGMLDLDSVFVAGFSLGCHPVLALLGGITDVARFSDWVVRNGGTLSCGPREFPGLADHFPSVLANNPSAQASWQRRAGSYRDRRMKAALLLAPAPPVLAFTDESLAAIEAPVHVLVGGCDTEASGEHGAAWLAGRLLDVSLDCLGADVGHHVFMSICIDAGRTAAPCVCLDAAVD